MAQTRPSVCVVLVFLLAALAGQARATLPLAQPVEARLPDELGAVRDFRAEPPAWNEGIVNAGSGAVSRADPFRANGWIAKPENWLLLDYYDRSGNLTTQRFLEHRGIPASIYGKNEYQETIHLYEDGALALFGRTGIARGIGNERVLDPFHNIKVERWAKKTGENAYITDNTSPRWWALINYDWLTSPLFGEAISQDNIGGPIGRIGASGQGRWSDSNDARFRAYLNSRGRWSRHAKRLEGKSLREAVVERHAELFANLPPYASKQARDDRKAKAAAARICEDPLLAEYQRFHYLAQLHAFQRHYRDNKLVAARRGYAYDVHGNLGGSFVGRIPYPVVLGESTDALWFEAAGQSQYDMFQNGWSNSWGAFRLQMSEAMGRGRRVSLFLPRLKKYSRDLQAHEWAEVSAGGGALLEDPARLEKAHPELMGLYADHLRFRDAHRAVFERTGRKRYAQVGLLYSVPTLMYRTFVPNVLSVSIEPVNDLAGAARALEEGHVPYDVVILDHPDLARDRFAQQDLSAYRLLIAPSIEALSSAHLDRLVAFLESGGTLLVLGKLGGRDEDYAARAGDPLARLRAAGKVLLPLGRASFPAARTRESEATRARSQALFGAVREAVAEPILDGDLPRLLWSKTWRHADGLLSVHLLNYDMDFASGKARPVPPGPIRVRVPEDLLVQQAEWWVPGAAARTLQFTRRGNLIETERPGLGVYGVLVLGPRGLDRIPSALRRGDRLLLRAELAGRSLADASARVARVRAQRSPAAADAYAAAAKELLLAFADERERALFARHDRMRDFGHDLVRAFDFGAAKGETPWQAVSADTSYKGVLGHGWLEATDLSGATPEERHYRPVREAGDPNLLVVRWLQSLSWPHDRRRRSAPLRRALISGRSQRFRVDLPNGLYRVDLLQANAGWGLRNFLVSGLTRANGSYVLLDTPLQIGEVRERGFVTRVEDGSLELQFGGPTGFGLAGLKIHPASAIPDDPLVGGGLRRWRVSARHPNPDWLPVDHAYTPIDANPAEPEAGEWQETRAPEAGLPVIDLGSPADAEIGDVVYAVASFDREHAGQAELSLGASSSAAAWLNGERVAYLPNLKGLSRDEARVPIRLRAGRNVLLLKLSRFWERRWLFYASVH